ncbi:MCE family protein [Nocardia sp. NPDC051570]|uniref:MCE family protein n=1 Tax=Nocardia sp. NPDC051570 TaxID=3364324 RepID=UPI0037923F2E
MRALWVAVLVVALITVAGTVFHLVERRTANVSLCAEFDDTAGLYAGNDVSVLGVTVGTVRSIVTTADHAEVRFTVDASVRLPVNVGAALVPGSIVTDRRLELTPVYASGPEYVPAHCIPLDRTHVPAGLTEALGASRSLADALSPEGGADALGPAIHAAGSALRDTGPAVRQTAADLAAALGDPATNDDRLSRLIDNTDQLLDGAHRQHDTLAALIPATAELARLLAESGPDAVTALRNANALLPQLAAAADAHGPALSTLLDSGATLGETVVRHPDSLSEFLETTPLAVQNVLNVWDPVAGRFRVQVDLPTTLTAPAVLAELCRRTVHDPVRCAAENDSHGHIAYGLTQLLLWSLLGTDRSAG